MWHDLGVGLRRELMTLRLQLSAQLGEVLDDAVVHDVDLALAVGVRVRVDVRRLAMGGPASVPDAEMAGRHPCLELGDEVVDLGLGLGDARPDQRSGPWRLQHGDPGRVIAAVLEAFQAVHEDRGGLLIAQVTDDPAHSSLHNS